MKLQGKDIQMFRKIFLEHYGYQISEEEALIYGRALLELLAISVEKNNLYL